MRRALQKKIFSLLLLLGLLLVPFTARAQVTDIITLLSTIANTLQSAVGQVVAEIETVTGDIRQFQQQLVWPLALIDQTRQFVSQVRGQLGTLSGQIHSLSVSSASLAGPKQFETVLRSGQSSIVPQLQPNFVKVFGQVPGAADANVTERNLADVDDAVSQESLKSAVISDQSTEQMLAAANAMEQETAAAAPGSAPILAGQAEVANLESQALLQKLLAAELRQEAIRIAHENMLRKQSAVATKDLNNHLQQILNRP